jgi:hypothetical protein
MVNKEINRGVNERINKGINEKINKQANKNKNEDENKNKKNEEDEEDEKNENKEDELIQLNKLIYKGAIYMGDQLIRRYMRDIANEIKEFLKGLK